MREAMRPAPQDGYTMDDLLTLIARSYAVVGIFHERLKLSVPFDIDIDLADVDNL
ncbi:hypothetical protein [Streptomyces sp. NPDC058155]|uniref:hypothetical protein n=1 Tax=Streptomyces sp. NPDC058155 TaxID=3346359 RepID=UPI0036E2AB25